jgi:hypothetical protein
MDQSGLSRPRRRLVRTLGLVAAPLVLLAVLPLAVLAALALYVRALVMALASLLPWPRRGDAIPDPMRAPHFAHPSRLGEQVK